MKRQSLVVASALFLALAGTACGKKNNNSAANPVTPALKDQAPAGATQVWACQGQPSKNAKENLVVTLFQDPSGKNFSLVVSQKNLVGNSVQTKTFYDGPVTRRIRRATDDLYVPGKTARAVSYNPRSHILRLNLSEYRNGLFGIACKTKELL